MKLLIHAGGYVQSPWRGDEMKEIRTTRGEVEYIPAKGETAKKCKWAPTTVDFAAAGVGSGTGSSSASNVAEMLKVIAAQKVESIEELRVIGHGNGRALALAGTTKCDDVYFDVEPALLGDFDTFNAAIPKCREVQDRFTRDAKVILMGCNGGSGSQELLARLSHAFLRTVQGFQEEVEYTFDYGPTDLPNGTLRRDTRITGRGRMRYGSPELHRNPWFLTPDATNNDGDVYAAIRDRNPDRGAVTLFWTLLREFYKTPWAETDHPWVSGTSVDPNGPGLRVIWRNNAVTSTPVSHPGFAYSTARGGHVEISSQFAAKTTPKTLLKRVAEIGKALELVAARQSGVIPAEW
jgi:hypothetical protein